MQVKVCGLTDLDSIKAIEKLPVNYMGFIFHEASPRNVVLNEFLQDKIRKLEKQKVGVFVNKDFDYMLQIGLALNLQFIQLHGNESPKLIDSLSPFFNVIKAFSVDENFEFSICNQYQNATWFLFDTKGEKAGGNGKKFDWSLLQNYQGDTSYFLGGGIELEDLERIEKLEDERLLGIDVNSKFEVKPGKKDLKQVNELCMALKKEKLEGFYGEFGGAFIPELLHNSIQELKSAFYAIREDKSFRKEYTHLLKDYVGRPTPLYYSKKLSAKYVANIYLKREDLNHTGAHKINNTIGQILLAKRMGKTRVIAETGAGQHGVATATVCALMDMECVIYMGAIDIERQAPNVKRMEMLGAKVIPAVSGSQTLKDATNEAIRDWISNPDSFYLIGSVVGPHPYPEMVAYFQAVISQEIEQQLLAKTGNAAPDLVIACVGGGSNAAGAFQSFLKDETVELILVEAAGLGLNSGKSAATTALGSTGIIHGSKTLMMQDEYGQIIEPHSISAGLDYPGIGPLHAHLVKSGRATSVAITDEEALKAGLSLTRSEGIIPALESAHALGALDQLELRNKTVVINLSGRGDKDLNTYLHHI